MILLISELKYFFSRHRRSLKVESLDFEEKLVKKIPTDFISTRITTLFKRILWKRHLF